MPCVALGMSLLAQAGAGEATALSSGIALEYMDSSVRPQDDFYRYVNGHWLASAQIPADRGRWGTYDEMREQINARLRQLLEAMLKDPGPADSERHKLAVLYGSFLDEKSINALGLKPLQSALRRISDFGSRSDIAAQIAWSNRHGVGAPFDFDVTVDHKDPAHYVVELWQSGLGLPDRDYYLNDDAHFAAIRDKYRAHVRYMLQLAGEPVAAERADEIVALETRIAQAQWSNAQNRDPVRTYNRFEVAGLSQLMPDFDWNRYLKEAGIAGHASYLLAGQPRYLNSLSGLLDEASLPVWKAYFKWQLIHSWAPYLPRRFVDADFSFNGTIIKDVPENRPRWKRGVALVNGTMGQALGHQYVLQNFPPESRERVQQIIANVITAFREQLDTLEWMSPATRVAAQAKLAALKVQVGYPEKWRDYSKLEVRSGELLGNIRRATEFGVQWELDKLGQPVDPDEWLNLPQQVDAYYTSDGNEAVFLAGILQPPLFDPLAEDASNYGGIGVVIGHEISHGFDERGSQFNAEGILADWWTAEDHEQFAARTSALVGEYAQFEAVPGYHLDGKVTLGENIADNSGLALAYRAYQLSLAGQPAPKIDGLSGDQRFYMGYAQVWRMLTRTETAIMNVKTDPHSPGEFRVRGAVVNQDPFYAAFDVRPGDPMYVPPNERIHLW